ncbi:MAG: hypothetical protein DRQ42_00620 [Gammaproteobacteria bacterium]|nr:MAG: hypothetical protein DRQ42_00620 [Gammaproteobacteria bacterium]
MTSYLDMIKKQREDLSERQQEDFERKEESTFRAGTVINADALPEDMELWRPKLGDHCFDVIPWISGPDHPYEEKGKYCWVLSLWVYQNVGSLRDQFISPASHWRDPDPIAEYMNSKHLPKEEYGKIRSKQRAFYLVWVHDTPEEEKKGVQLWEVAHFFIVSQLKEASQIPMGGGLIPYMDHKKGKSVFISIKSEGSFTDGDGNKRDSIQFSAPKFVERKAVIPDNILSKSVPVDGLINMHPSYELMYKAFWGKEYDGEAVHAEAPPTSLTNKVDAPTTMTQGMSEMDRVADEPAVEEGVCPAGHDFGADLDKFEKDCNGCVSWNTCSDALDKLKEAEGEAPPVIQQETAALKTRAPIGKKEPEVAEEKPAATSRRRRRILSRT